VCACTLQHHRHQGRDEYTFNALQQRQVAAHEWVSNSGRLPPLKLCAGGGATGAGDAAAGGGGAAAAAAAAAPTGAQGAPSGAEQAGALTAWVHQVKAAVPSVEERLFKRGHVLIR
jgi:hypothetical protein